MKTIQSVWDSFEKVVLKEKSDLQCREMKKAFYFGSFTLLTMQIKLANSGISDDDAAMQVEEWLRECQDFFEGHIPVEQDHTSH